MLNYPVLLSHLPSITVSLETYPLYSKLEFYGCNQCQCLSSLPKWEEIPCMDRLLFLCFCGFPTLNFHWSLNLMGTHAQLQSDCFKTNKMLSYRESNLKKTFIAVGVRFKDWVMSLEEYHWACSVMWRVATNRTQVIMPFTLSKQGWSFWSLDRIHFAFGEKLRNMLSFLFDKRAPPYILTWYV